MANSAEIIRFVRFARLICILTLLPALLLLIPHSFTAHQMYRRPGVALPAVGLIPLTISAFVGAQQSAVWRTHLGYSSAPLFKEGSVLAVIVDGSLAVALLVLTVVSDVWMCRKLSGTGFILLGAYGTVPMIINFFIHALLALLAVTQLSQTQGTCPHCHRNVGNSAKGRGEYERLVDDEERQGLQDESFLDHEDPEACRRAEEGN